MDGAKKTHVFEMNPNHRAELHLLPSFIICFGREREQQLHVADPRFLFYRLELSKLIQGIWFALSVYIIYIHVFTLLYRL